MKSIFVTRLLVFCRKDDDPKSESATSSAISSMMKDDNSMFGKTSLR